MKEIPLPPKVGSSEPIPVSLFDVADAELSNQHVIASSVVLEAFSAPIVFQRIFVDMTGSVTAALMLSQAISITDNLAPETQGWFEQTSEEWQRDIGLSRFEQQTARKVLKDLGYLHEARRGIPGRIVYWIDCSRVWASVSEISKERWSQKSDASNNQRSS
jgi:hypothetical protein